MPLNLLCSLLLLLALAARPVSALVLVNPAPGALDPAAAFDRLLASHPWPLPQVAWTGSDPAALAAKEHFSGARAPLYSQEARAAGKLLVTTPQGDRWCSASVVATRLVLTAAACVHDGQGRTAANWYTRFVFFAAFEIPSSQPDAWDWAAVTVPDVWTTSQGTLPHAANYALLELRDQGTTPVGAVYPRFTPLVPSPYPQHGTLLAYSVNREEGDNLYTTAAASVRKGLKSNAEYRSDVTHGAVGAPLVQHFGWPAAGQPAGQANRVFGVVSYGYAHGLLVGFSPFDARFQTLFDQACRRRLNNCAPVR